MICYLRLKLHYLKLLQQLFLKPKHHLPAISSSWKSKNLFYLKRSDHDLFFLYNNELLNQLCYWVVSSACDQEEQRRALAEEREKRAAAAERRIAALNIGLSSSKVASASLPEPKSESSNLVCSCCNASLEGKIPFHRYNYKYCSTSCMHVHREILEDG